MLPNDPRQNGLERRCADSGSQMENGDADSTNSSPAAIRNDGERAHGSVRPEPVPEPAINTEFAASDQKFLRIVLTLFLTGFGIQWVRAILDRPQPITVQRGEQFDQFFRVDVNTATWIEWMQLESVGVSLAHRIEADRRLNGPFASIEDVQRVPGIGPKTLDRIRPWLTISHANENQQSSQFDSHAR